MVRKIYKIRFYRIFPYMLLFGVSAGVILLNVLILSMHTVRASQHPLQCKIPNRESSLPLGSPKIFLASLPRVPKVFFSESDERRVLVVYVFRWGRVVFPGRVAGGLPPYRNRCFPEGKSRFSGLGWSPFSEKVDILKNNLQNCR